MTVTAKELRFNVAMLFDVLEKGENILITYRGKAKAKLIPCDTPEKSQKSDEMFGMWADREESVDAMVREMRRGREFGI